jgi:signal transduction histidine kinase
VNAAHAIGDVVEGTEGRGRIVLRTRREPGFAVVEIEDSGGGIPADIQEKIWDPFFTTKPVGKGTGQGLTIARSIVVKHGGMLSFESFMGKGTTFVIRLPLAGREGEKGEPSHEVAA